MYKIFKKKKNGECLNLSFNIPQSLSSNASTSSTIIPSSSISNVGRSVIQYTYTNAISSCSDKTKRRRIKNLLTENSKEK